ncbi:MAG: maltose alpha-D-glucosyltransferase [Candidatus Bathyarchaeota archaeon]
MFEVREIEGSKFSRYDKNLENEPLWYKDAIIYEVHVKTFYDSNGDGIGDFEGLTAKLDHLKDLGITAIWLLPFYPSPLKDDGYDITDYFNIHPQYGTLKDFKEFLREAHKRGIRVITELVLNHTSDEHPWFQRSRRAVLGSKWRNLYVWSDSPERYKEARIIFKDFETSNWRWDPVAKAYYWHRFYSHQPELNYDNKHAQKAATDVINFWLDMGVDGLRLDAVPYLFEREGTNCENLPETHLFLKKLRAHVDTNFKNKMLLAEANQWPTDAVAYFGEGNECHMAYHFPLMPRMFMAIQMEDRFPIIEILEHTPKIPENCQWALFLRNHDELTLEMVTDEERDYMYKMYAKDKQARINLGIRRRLAPLLGNDRKKIELMNFLLFTMPGTPVIYYGDEIGMGDHYYLGDRNGVRTPMQWNANINAGFSKANPQKLYLPVIIDPEYHYQTVNAENQQNQSSLLWWMKKMINIRKRFKAFSRGKIDFLSPDNTRILAFIRKYEDEKLLVAANLSRNPQVAELDLSQYSEFIPQDAFGGTSFPPVGKSRYMLTFAPYGYYILALTEQVSAVVPPCTTKLHFEKKTLDLTDEKNVERLESLLPAYISSCRWFGGKARQIERIKIKEKLNIETVDSINFILIIDVDYKEGFTEAYLLPVAYASGETAKQICKDHPHAVIATLEDEERIIYDCACDEKFQRRLLSLIFRRQTVKGSKGELVGIPRKQLRKSISLEQLDDLQSRLLGAEQSNTSIIFKDKFILKLIRRVEQGINPELDIGDMLTKISFPNIPPLLGDIRYTEGESEPVIIAMLQGFIKSGGDAWKLYLDENERYFERVLSQKDRLPEITISPSILELTQSEIPEQLTELTTPTFIEMTALLGKRTGEFHMALLADKENPDFAPETFSYHYQASVSQSMISYAERILELADKLIKPKPGVWKEWGGITESRELIVERFKALRQRKKGLEDIIAHRDMIKERFRALQQRKIEALKLRVHGDYHLGQVLYTGKDFIMIDFEGEPARSLSDRRLKRSPLRDVAGMIRSFHYVAYMGLFKHDPLKPEENALLEKWADLWYKIIAATFLKAYLNTITDTGIAPKDLDILSVLLDAFLLEKAIYELGYEMNNRPDWMVIPIRGIKDLLRI